MTRSCAPCLPWFPAFVSLVATCGCSDVAPAAAVGGAGGVAGSVAAGAPATGGSVGTGGSVELRGRCSAGTRSGDFSAVREPDLTAVRGQVWDRASSSRLLTEVARAGDCWLTKSEPARCASACSGAETCGAGGQCVAATVSRSVGIVRISGLAEPVEMAPLMPGNNYFVAGDFPARGFEPGSTVQLTAEGGDVTALSLRGFGVEALALPEADWILEPGQPFVVGWTAGSVAQAVVRLSLNVDQHGGAPVNLSCETADDGELEVETTLVDALLDAGVTGFPSGHLNRETVDSVVVAGGCIELAVAAHVRRGLGVEGYVACMKASDCPDGKTCNAKLQRCE